MITPADILAARSRIQGLIATTPLERSAPLSALTGAEVYLKLECVQTTGSFKLRGATNALLEYQQTASSSLPLRVVACSAGNHALGMAHAASALGIDTTLVLPEHASPAKVAALRRYPVRLVLHGDYDAAEAEALRIARDEGRRFVSPYNDPAVIAGQGTLGVEVFEQLAGEVWGSGGGGESGEGERGGEDRGGHGGLAVLVPVGGGGLISGVAVWAKAIRPDVRVIGLQPEVSAVLAASLKAGEIVMLPDAPSLADGLAGSVEQDTVTLPLMQRYVDDMLTLSEDEIAAAMRWLLDEHHLVVEGSGAVGVAALLNGKVGDIAGQRVVVVLTGRNVSTEVLLRAVAP